MFAVNLKILLGIDGDTSNYWKTASNILVHCKRKYAEEKEQNFEKHWQNFCGFDDVRTTLIMQLLPHLHILTR